MQIELSHDGNKITVYRESSDRKYGKRESQFYYDLKKAISEKFGVDVVKKLAHKDGHLVDDNQYYIRHRKGEWCIYYEDHALRYVTEDFDAGKVTLNVYRFIEHTEGIKSEARA
jgi:hypothetical protein